VCSVSSLVSLKCHEDSVSQISFVEKLGILISAGKDKVMRFWKLEDVEVNFEESYSEETSSDSDNPFLPHYDDKQFLEMEMDFKNSSRGIHRDSNSNLGFVRNSKFRMSQGPPDTMNE